MMMLVSQPQRVRIVFPKGLFVADDVGVADRRQDPDFVEGVFLFLFVEVAQLDPLQGVLVVVGQPLHLVDGAVRAFAW